MKTFGAVVALTFGLVAAAWLHGPIQAQTEASGESKTVGFADATEQHSATGEAATGRRKLSDREARRLGITFLSVRSALKELKASGEISGSESNAELSVIVADHLAAKKENKAAFAKEGVDWDSLLAFIEKLVTLIMKLFVL